MTPETKHCAVDIRRSSGPRSTPGKETPADEIPLMATAAAVLSEGKRSLLHLIRDKCRESLTELTGFARRQVPSLSPKLHMTEGYDLVDLKKNVRGTDPIVLASSLKTVID